MIARRATLCVAPTVQGDFIVSFLDRARVCTLCLRIGQTAWSSSVPPLQPLRLVTAIPLEGAPSRSARVALRRAFGLAFGLAVSVGLTIGAGILRAPADVAVRLPDVRLFFAAWVAGGVYAMLGANALSELAAMLPQSGGQYVYAERAFGPYVGFVVGWSDWASTCGTVAAIAIVLAESAGVLAPPLGGHTSERGVRSKDTDRPSL